jgi:ubiquitin
MAKLMTLEDLFEALEKGLLPEGEYAVSTTPPKDMRMCKCGSCQEARDAAARELRRLYESGHCVTWALQVAGSMVALASQIMLEVYGPDRFNHEVDIIRDWNRHHDEHKAFATSISDMLKAKAGGADVKTN